MYQAFTHFLTLTALNTAVEVYYGLALAWLLFLGTGISSVLSSRGALRLKLFWMALIIGLPVIGLFAYCVVCILCADYGFLKLFGLHSNAASYLMSPPTLKNSEQ